MGVGQSANPNASSIRNRLVSLKSRSLFVREELVVIVARLDRLEDHRTENGPLGQQFHATWIDHEWLVEEHGLEPRDAFLLDLAHPPVITDLTDGIDRLFRVLARNDRSVCFLDVDWCERYQPVHPVGPKVFVASRFVVAKDAG